jgi:hypothetical protein
MVRRQHLSPEELDPQEAPCCEECGRASEGIFVTDTEPRRYMVVCEPCARALERGETVQ